MTTDSRISELVARFESLRGAGQSVSIEQLCAEYPELADEVRRMVTESDPGGALTQVSETLAESSVASATPSIPEQKPAVGPRFPAYPGYEFIAELGRGGMGVVYKARQMNLNRLVAIKTILAGAHAGTRERARFYAEAESVARLQHPNIVQIFDISECDGAPYFSMEFVDGSSLHRRLQGQPVDALSAALMIETLAVAIHYAHQRGIVHRDLKPANILLSGGDELTLRQCTPKLTDFGLAKQLKDDVRLTQTGVVLGTPCYMAPEQVEDPSTEVTPSVDVYGLGALLYEMLTGRPPFTGATNFETMQQVVSEDPVRPSLLQPSVPAALERICLKCLNKRPQDRYPTAQALADDLSLFLDGQQPTAALERPSGMRRRPARRTSAAPRRSWLARHWQSLSLALLAAVVVGMGMIGASHFRSDENRLAGKGKSDAALPVSTLPPIKVGILHSLTGTMALSESAVVDTTQFAIDEINQQGGLLGRRIEAVVRDGQSEPAIFAREAENLIDTEKVCTVFGCWTSASRKTVMPIFEAHDNLLVYSVEFEGLELSPNIAYVGATANQQIIPAVKWCFAFLEKRRFFLVGSDYVFPHAANEIIKDELKAIGGEVVGEAYLPMGSGDVAGIIEQIKASKPDVILNAINGDSNVAFFRALRNSGIKPSEVPVVSFSIGEQELRSMNIADLVGDYAARNYFQSTDRTENRDFLKRFWARYGSQRVMGDAMESAYLGVHLWAKAVLAARSDDPAKIREAMRGQEYIGPGGRVYMDPKLLNTHRISRIGRVRPDGQFDVVWDSGTPIAPEIYPKTRTREQWDNLLQGLYKKWGNSWGGPIDD